MDARGIRLHAVVHESLGAEDFKQFIKGDVYLDPERHFYGPQERWINILTVFSFTSVYRVIKVIREGVSGNMEGQGLLLGAVFVVGPGDQGIVFQHHEKSIGESADLDEVRAAIAKVNQPLQ